MPYAPIDLLHDVDGLAAALRDADEPDDAFLLAAALSQVLEDRRHRDVLALGKVAEVARAIAPLALLARRVAFALRALRPGERATAARAAEALALAESLAEAVLAGRKNGDRPFFFTLDGVPERTRRTLARLPGSFQTFDQHPEDCRSLARAFAARDGDRATPLVVVGLRTSGSYLAPLVAAALREEGYGDVTVRTVRPGQPSRRRERRALRRAAAGGARVLVVDDPPRSGRALAAALRELEAAGVPGEALTLLLARADPPEATPPLAGRDEVTLRWEDWHVHRRLEPDTVRVDLERLLAGRTVGGVEVGRVASAERLAAAEPPRRRHMRARFAVVLVDARDGTTTTTHIDARGAGFGFYARHTATLAERLDGLVPPPYGLRDGVVYEPVASDVPAAVDALGLSDALAERIAEHVASRAERLAVGEDKSLRVAGENAIWELAADAVARSFSALRTFVRPLAHGVGQRLLAAEHPAVIDGGTGLARWRSRGERVLKFGYAGGAFGAGDRFCYDPVFDLAGPAAEATVRSGEPVFADALRAAFERRTGGEPAPERWMLNQLVRLAITREVEGDPHLQVERAMGRVHARWAGERLLAGPRPDDGPLCAVDVDGVLETRWNGFSAISPPAADALRALAAHGLRVVLCTGRSIDDVRERCADYGLAGGVAEYGAVLYDHAAQRTETLLDDAARTALGEVHAALVAREGIEFEPGRGASVRAFRRDARGARRGLDDPDVEAALAAAGGSGHVAIVPGDLQTDFHAAGFDKGEGLRALVALLGAPSVAMAVGDTRTDAPMLALAAEAYAPAHARAALKASGVRVMRGAYGFGLRDAAAAHLGHAPGGCEICRRTARPPAVEALLTALAAREQGRARKLGAAWRIARLLRRSGRPGSPAPA